jgi:hypothetical protein
VKSPGPMIREKLSAPMVIHTAHVRPASVLAIQLAVPGGRRKRAESGIAAEK